MRQASFKKLWKKKSNMDLNLQLSNGWVKLLKEPEMVTDWRGVTFEMSYHINESFSRKKENGVEQKIRFMKLLNDYTAIGEKPQVRIHFIENVNGSTVNEIRTMIFCEDAQSYIDKRI
jgi:hypothetical protein